MIEEAPEMLLRELRSFLPKILCPYFSYLHFLSSSAPPEDNRQGRKQSGNSAAVHHQFVSVRVGVCENRRRRLLLLTVECVWNLGSGHQRPFRIKSLFGARRQR